MSDILTFDSHISRRKFLKWALFSTAALALGRSNVAKAEALIRNDRFDIDVHPWDGNLFYPSTLNFNNSIDFPLRPTRSKKTKVQNASLQENIIINFIHKPSLDNYPNPLLISASNPVTADIESEKTEFLSLVVDALSIPAYALTAGELFRQYSKSSRKSLAIAGGAILTTGLVKAAAAALQKTASINDPSFYEKQAGKIGQYYPIFPQFSSMRAVLIMFDIWQNLDTRYHQKSFQAISFSKTDALESFVKFDPLFIKRQLLADTRFDGTIIQTAISAGSLEAVFAYQIQDLMTGQYTDCKFSDWRFISELKYKLGNRIPPKPPSWSANA